MWVTLNQPKSPNMPHTSLFPQIPLSVFNPMIFFESHDQVRTPFITRYQYPYIPQIRFYPAT